MNTNKLHLTTAIMFASALIASNDSVAAPGQQDSFQTVFYSSVITSDESDSTSSDSEESEGYSDSDLESFLATQDTSPYYSDIEISAYLDTAITEVNGEVIDFSGDVYTDYLEDSYVELNSSSDSYSITEAGTYLLTGNINSTIRIEVGEDEDVRLVLQDASIISDDGPAIVVVSADDVEISLVEDSVNYLEDSATRETDDEDYDAALYSDCDLLLNGSGSLTITANYNNGLKTKDDLKLLGLNLYVASVDDGVVGKDSVAVKDAVITIYADGDALKSSNEDDDKGFVVIESGTVEIDSGDDGISAENIIAIYDAELSLTSEGKGLKSETDILVGGGEFLFSTTDHAIDANLDATIYDGTFTLDSSLGDGIKASEYLTINGGTFEDINTVEGLEARYLTINSGYIDINSSDDGLNAASDYDDNTLVINGGFLLIESNGDSVDSNGTATVNGGTIIANGPTSNEGNSCFDIDNSFMLNYGTIFAFGNSQMASDPASYSSQPSISFTGSSDYDSGTTVTLSTSSGTEIMSLWAINDFDHLLIAHPDMTVGSSYNLQVGDSESMDITVSSVTTTVSESGDYSSDLDSSMFNRR
ncbi:uncharacterized protein DUF4353 [Reinekea marinisedimentorum]|uniref:Uncharacterized protein DUF4353 n=2 Tax=Reinekea marinisedimentorum TaxID=230495 RepID=A0A4R3ICA7_9GAMM|nr:uncharacterized protein DUF4353 [Reinekea marinisedimentorum]